MESQSAGQKILCAFAFKPATRNCVTVTGEECRRRPARIPAAAAAPQEALQKEGRHHERHPREAHLRDDEPGQGRAPEC
jgi:hypothetical protein